MKTTSTLIMCFLVIRTSSVAQITSMRVSRPVIITLAKELNALYDISELPSYQERAVESEVSTYDLTGGNDDGFKGTFSYVRRNIDSSLVIFDVKGCGVINRIWTPTPTDDTLDFYIDDTNRAILSIKYRDLFSGRVFPFVPPLTGSRLGGNFCYLPMPFQHRCVIVCRGKKMQFHQIQYRLYSEGTLVKKFSPLLDSTENIALGRIRSLWSMKTSVLDSYHDSTARKIDETSKVRLSITSVELFPGQTKIVFNREQGGRILGITIDSANEFAGDSKDVDIRIRWDNEAEPAVYCPVADFFGYAFGQPSMHSLLLGTQGDKNYCYFPMPFNRAAKIELINRSAGFVRRSIRCKIRIYYCTVRQDPKIEGKFYANWRTDRLSADQPKHILLQAQGKGHCVGTILQAQGLVPGMTSFFEGDDSTATDGQFRIHGTGSEDYFNGGWYGCPDRWDSRQSLPIHGSLNYSIPLCRTGGYRIYLSDKIPFEKNIFQSIEHGLSAKGIPVNYTSVSFYYCNIGSPTQKPLNELTRVYEPDTLMLYPQLMKFDLWGSMNFKAIGMYPIGGRSCIYSTDDQSRLKISLDGIPSGKYSLFGDITKYNEGCSFAVWQGQNQVSEWINTNQGDTQRIKSLYLCELDTRNLPEALNSITLTFKTAPDAYSLFLNRFILIKRKEATTNSN